MKLLSTQIALFPNKLIERPDLVYEEIKSAEKGLFDAMPNIIDLPLSAPSDLPLVQAHSINGTYVLNISRGRIDFLINFTNSIEDEPFELYKKERSKIDIFNRCILKLMNVMRIGIIFTLFDQNEKNVKTIYEKYMNIPYTAKCSEISIRTNNQQQIKGFILNNITMIEGNELHIKHESTELIQKGILIQTDINNVPKQDVILTIENISSILSVATNRLKPNEIKEMI